MATQPAIAQYVLERLSVCGDVTMKKMFGEYGLYGDGVLFGMICDDEVFVKRTPGAAVFLGDCPDRQPYPGAKPHAVLSRAQLDDAERLRAMIRAVVTDLAAHIQQRISG